MRNPARCSGKRQIEDYKKGYSATAAPIDREESGGRRHGRRRIRHARFIDAYDADTGKRVWRFYTVAGEGEPGGEYLAGDSWKRGGGSTWITGTYDPELNLIYWGTGNPGPDLNGDVRPRRQSLHVQPGGARRRHRAN